MIQVFRCRIELTVANDLTDDQAGDEQNAQSRNECELCRNADVTEAQHHHFPCLAPHRLLS
jgi:hypothetical protein